MHARMNIVPHRSLVHHTMRTWFYFHWKRTRADEDIPQTFRTVQTNNNSHNRHTCTPQQQRIHFPLRLLTIQISVGQGPGNSRQTPDLKIPKYGRFCPYAPRIKFRFRQIFVPTLDQAFMSSIQIFPVCG